MPRQAQVTRRRVCPSVARGEPVSVVVAIRVPTFQGWVEFGFNALARPATVNIHIVKGKIHGGTPVVIKAGCHLVMEVMPGTGASIIRVAYVLSLDDRGI